MGYDYSEKRKNIAALQSQGSKMFRNANGSDNKMNAFTDTIIVELSLIPDGASPLLDAKAVLFDALNPDVDAENAGSGDYSNGLNGVLIHFPMTTHAKVREKIKGGGFSIVSATYNYGVDEQFSKVFSTSFEDINGDQGSRKYVPATKRTSKDFSNRILDLDDFRLAVDPLTRLEIPLVKELGTAKVTLIFKINAIVQPGAEMYGKMNLQTNY